MINRIQTIDAIRGFALFGIFIVNILAFSSVYFGTGISPPDGLSFVDRSLSFTVSTLFELKFYLLFSFLFGYSVILQIQSAERASTRFMPRMIRRQIGLFIIGALHAIFLFHGDILTTYALLGMILLMVRNWPNKTLLSLAIGLIVLIALIWIWIAFEQYRQPDLDQTIEANALLAAMINTWRGTPIQIIGQYIDSFGDFMPILLILQAPCALALFLIGFVVGRARLFERPDFYRPYLARSALIGLIIGLPGGLIYAGMTQFMAGTTIEMIGLALSILTAPLLSRPHTRVAT